MVFCSRFIGFFLLLISFSTVVSAQVKPLSVESKVYDTMLNSLLSRNVPEISVDELSDISNDVILLDAREKQEYQVSHLSNAIFIGYNDFDISEMKHLSKDSKIVVYCSVGYRSEKISEQLIKAGYANVSNLYGGIFEWKNTNHSVFDAQENETESVHAYDSVWGIWLNKGKKIY